MDQEGQVPAVVEGLAFRAFARCLDRSRKSLGARRSANWPHALVGSTNAVELRKARRALDHASTTNRAEHGHIATAFYQALGG